jgi:D-alanine--poly(phosphoribitol) ligase subunit 2
VQATIQPLSEIDGLARLAEDVRSLFLEKLAIRIELSNTDLFANGVLDSMSLVQLILELENRFEVKLPIGELEIAAFRSIGEIARLVAQRRLAQGS